MGSLQRGVGFQMASTLIAGSQSYTQSLYPVVLNCYCLPMGPLLWSKMYNPTLSLCRNLISAPGNFGKDFIEDGELLKGFRFLSKPGITHPNWDL